MDLPYVEKHLIEYLEKIYPEKAPDLKDTERVIWVKAGQAHLVRNLRMLYDQQLKRSIKG